MKTTSILLSFALAFKAIYSRAIDNNQNNIKNGDSFEMVKNKNYVYKFHCSDEKQYCDKLKNDIDFAFNTISNALEIYQPISFEVYVDDISLKYGLNGTLAAVLDINYVSLRESKDKSSAPFIYPQALTKQLKINKQPKYKENDFHMLINNCNSLPEFKNNEIRSIMTHEIFHGLGFASLASVSELTENENVDLGNGVNKIKFDKNAHYIIFPGASVSYNEKLKKITDRGEYLNELLNIQIDTFRPFSVFDKHMVSMKTGKKVFDDMKFLYKEINQNCLIKDGSHVLLKDANDKYLSDCFKTLSPETQDNITHIVSDNFFEPDTLGILTSDGEIVPLQTMLGVYIPGSSVSHINNPLYDEYFKRIKENGIESEEANELLELSGKFKEEYVLKYYDDNYLLYFSDEDDFTVEDMLKLLPNNKKHPLIGNGIIKVMKTLGWTEKGMKRNTKLHYLDETLELPASESFEYIYKKRYELLENENKNKTNTTNNGQKEEKADLTKRSLLRFVPLR